MSSSLLILLLVAAFIPLTSGSRSILMRSAVEDHDAKAKKNEDIMQRIAAADETFCGNYHPECHLNREVCGVKNYKKLMTLVCAKACDLCLEHQALRMRMREEGAPPPGSETATALA